MKEDKTLFIKTDSGYKVYTNTYNLFSKDISMKLVGRVKYSNMREAYRYFPNIWLTFIADDKFYRQVADFMTKLNRGSQ